jgi:hypothetical protein
MPFNNLWFSGFLTVGIPGILLILRGIVIEPK